MVPDDASRAAGIRYTDVMFPDRNDRPAIHYIYSQLPYWAEIKGQFLIQYDIIGLGKARRKVINVPGIVPMDGEGGRVPGAVAMGNLLFTSVLLGTEGTGKLAGSLEEQTKAAFANAFALVEAGGFDKADVGHAYVWYADHTAREGVDRAWATIYPKPDDRPARHSVVGNLTPGALVGVELTASR